MWALLVNAHSLMKRILGITVAVLCLLAFPVRTLVITEGLGPWGFVGRVSPGEVISVNYIHSVERTPWQHYYRVETNNKLRLMYMRFKSFGAGVPDYAPIVRHVDGWIEYAGFELEYESLTWNVQAELDHYLNWRGQDIHLGTLVASGSDARIYVRYRPIGYYLLNKISMWRMKG